MRSQLLPILLIAALIPCAYPSLCPAVPALPEYGVNHSARECGQFFMGDECVACRMPEGWTSLGVSARDICPQGYTKVEVRAECFPQKNEFCCTRGHSGAPGNCSDLVINDRQRLCAFVDDAKKCGELPAGWQKPTGTPACPFPGYTWQKGLLACPGEYAPPLVNGARVDWCLIWGADCGQPAADYFCNKQGYARAETWRKEPAETTFIIGDGTSCSGAGRCDGFSFIRCSKTSR